MNIQTALFTLAQGETTKPQGSPLISFLPLILIFVIMYMLLIRPQQKKNKQHQELIKKLKAGDKVVTAGGMHGVIAGVKDKTILVEVADGVKIEFSRTSVISINAEA
jgi:preprotein translocase subunit YajC